MATVTVSVSVPTWMDERVSITDWLLNNVGPRGEDNWYREFGGKEVRYYFTDEKWATMFILKFGNLTKE